MQISGTQEFYWVAAHDYFLGSTVSPGHWGRVISSCPVGVPRVSRRVAEGQAGALREFIFESVRLTINPQLPSRLNSVFLCPSEPEARWLVRHEAPARDHEFVYRIEPVGTHAGFRASLELAAIEVGDTVRSLKEKARLYWSGLETAHMEVLMTCPIRIREKLPCRTGTPAGQPTPRHSGPIRAPRRAEPAPASASAITSVVPAEKRTAQRSD